MATESQVKHYIDHKKSYYDIVIPIGIEAIFYLEKNDIKFIFLGSLWSKDEYYQARNQSQRKIDVLVGEIDNFSAHLNPEIQLEMGSYYAFQLWIIIGQIHYNQFILRSAFKMYTPDSVLAYTKNKQEAFLEFRPDPDCILANTLLCEAYIDDSRIEIIGLDEKVRSQSIKQWILNKLPTTWAERFRGARDWWRFFRIRRGEIQLLLIGGGYDWIRASKIKLFHSLFSIKIIPRRFNRYKKVPINADLRNLLNNSIGIANNRVFYDIEKLAKAIVSDIFLFQKIYFSVEKKIIKYKAVISAVLTHPWDNFLANIARKNALPLIIWQHGEKGQCEDVSNAYTELNYATDYFSYSNGVSNFYEKFTGIKSLIRIHTVGSFEKKINWNSGDAIIYATGKIFKSSAPFPSMPDPDGRLYKAHKTILNYLDSGSFSRKIIFKANNTPRLNDVPYRFKNVHIERISPFIELLQNAKLVILDTPATTLVEACSTRVPIFALAGRENYFPEFIEAVKRRVVWCESAEELVEKLDAFINLGIYDADVDDRVYLEAYCSGQEADVVLDEVKRGLFNAMGLSNSINKSCT